MSMATFEETYGPDAKKIHVSTNSYVENSEGDTVHICELSAESTLPEGDAVEIEDSLRSVAEDALELKIASSVKYARSPDDVLYLVAKKADLSFELEEDPATTRQLRLAIRNQLRKSDFDVLETNKSEDPKSKNIRYNVSVSFPSRTTIRKKLRKMIEASDLVVPG
jgi:hypothetical protein